MSQSITFRISDELYTELVFKANLSGYNLSEYCRVCCLNNQKEIKFKSNKEKNYSVLRLALLRKISTNINQIAKRLNGLAKKNISEEYSRDLMFETRDKMNLILEILKEI